MNADDLDTVLTFGGQGNNTFHVAVRRDGDLRALCGAAGTNPFLKERSLIEGHYTPCQNCFQPGRRAPADAVTSTADDGFAPDGGREGVNMTDSRPDDYDPTELSDRELLERIASFELGNSRLPGIASRALELLDQEEKSR